MTVFVPKDIDIKMNLLLYRTLNEQNGSKKGLVLFLFFPIEHMFWIFVRIALGDSNKYRIHVFL